MPDDFHAEERRLATQATDSGTFDQYRLYMINAIQRMESGQAVLSRDMSEIKTSIKLVESELAEIIALKKRVADLEAEVGRFRVYLGMASAVIAAVTSAVVAWIFKKF